MDDNKRFVAPAQGSQFESEYDLSSANLIDLNQRDVAPLAVRTLDLSSAGTLPITVPGRAFVPYFFETGTTNKVQTQGLITVFVNESNSSNNNVALPCQHNRGFRGSFSQLYLTWAAQAGVSVDFVIHKSKRTPWMTSASVGGGATPASGIVGLVSPKSVSFTVDVNTFFPVNASGGAIVAGFPGGGTSVGIGQVASIQKVDSSTNAITVLGLLGGTVTLHNQLDAVTAYWSGSAWVPFA